MMNKSKVIQFYKCFAVFLWLSLLVKTDSYYSIYLILGILAIILISKNKKQPKNTWLEYLFASFLSLTVTLSNYSILIRDTGSETISILLSILLFSITFVCGFIIFLNILSPFKKIYIKTTKTQTITPQKIFLISFLIFSLLDLFVLFTCCYPGSLTPDSIDEIGQILSGSYSNHHPFYFTILIYPFIMIGTNLFNDINIGVALFNIFQILIISTAFAYSISTLYRIGLSKKILIILSVILAILPYNLIYSFTIWKDILFSAAFLFFTVTLYRYLNNIHPYKKSQLLQNILIFISGLIVCLFRSNALLAIVISTIIFFIIFRKKYIKLSIILFLIVLSAFILKRPVLKALNVNQPDLIESLSIPSQQIARTLKYDKNQLSEEDISLINNIADVDALAKAYIPSIHDPIKNVVRGKGNQEYIREHILDFILLYAKLGFQHPIQYLTSWIDITRGYWNGGYNYWIWADDITLNNYGIARSKNSNIFKKILSVYLEEFPKITFLQPLISIGLAVWILLLLFYYNFIKRNKVNLFLLIPILSTWTTLLIATPVFSEFRYVYCIFICLPFLTIISFTKNSPPKNKTKELHAKE